MEYTVNFRSVGHICPAHLESRKIGMVDVRRIREELGVPELSLEKISGYRTIIARNPSYSVPEDMAERCGHFAHTWEVEVTVPGRSLNRFVREEVEADRSPETGEVTAARLEPVLDKAAVLEAWEAAGFPLEWNPAAEEDSEEEAEGGEEVEEEEDE